MKVKFERLHTVILFSILFITIGWIAPAGYAAYAPQDQYIEAHEFDAQDATTSADSHLICFDRTVRTGYTGTAITELLIVSDDGDTIEVDSRTMERYFQAGHRSVKARFPLPEYLEEGEYRYVLVTELRLAQGRVQREFTFHSETFRITEKNTKNHTKDSFDCG